MTADTVEQDAKQTRDPGAILEGFKYRDQGRRYPWWVKSANRFTVETDTSTMEKPTTHIILMKLLERMQSDVELPSQRPNH